MGIKDAKFPEKWRETEFGKVSASLVVQVKNLIEKRAKYLESIESYKAVDLDMESFVVRQKGQAAEEIKHLAKGIKYLDNDAELQSLLDECISKAQEERVSKAQSDYLLREKIINTTMNSAREVDAAIKKIHSQYEKLVGQITAAKSALETLHGMLDLPCPAPAPVEKPAAAAAEEKPGVKKAALEKQLKDKFEEHKAKLLNPDASVEGSIASLLAGSTKFAEAAEAAEAVKAATKYSDLVDAEYVFRKAVGKGTDAERKAKQAEYKELQSEIASLEKKMSAWVADEDDQPDAIYATVSKPSPAVVSVKVVGQKASEPAEFKPTQIDAVNEALAPFREYPLFLGQNAKHIHHESKATHGKGDYTVVKGTRTGEYVRVVTEKALKILENLSHLPGTEENVKDWYQNHLKTKDWSEELFGSPAEDGFDPLSYNIGLTNLLDEMGQELHGLMGLRDSSKHEGDVKYDLE